MIGLTRRTLVNGHLMGMPIGAAPTCIHVNVFALAPVPIMAVATMTGHGDHRPPGIYPPWDSGHFGAARINARLHSPPVYRGNIRGAYILWVPVVGMVTVAGPRLFTFEDAHTGLSPPEVLCIGMARLGVSTRLGLTLTSSRPVMRVPIVNPYGNGRICPNREGANLAREKSKVSASAWAV